MALDSSELRSVHDFKLNDETTTSTPDRPEKVSLAERAEIKGKLSLSNVTNKYLDFGFLLPASNNVDRHFSEAGHTLNDIRRSLMPSNFESQVFLHFSWHMWAFMT